MNVAEAEQVLSQFRLDHHMITYIQFMLEKWPNKHNSNIRKKLSVYLYPENDYKKIKEYFKYKGYKVRKSWWDPWKITLIWR